MTRTLKLMKRHGQAWFGAAVVLVLLVAAIASPLVATYDPYKVNVKERLEAPSAEHWMGTDNLGRDVYSRVVYGARVSLLSGFVAVGISMCLGVVLGILSGYLGGWVDMVIQRIVDGFMAFPGLVLMIAFSAIFGPGLVNAMIAIGITGTPGWTRLVRGQVIAIKRREYVEAAQALGATSFGIGKRHIFPNVLAPIIVWASMGVGNAILAEAGLSFLGLGTQPPTASWGSMVNQGNQYLATAPWMSLFPGGAVFVVVLASNLLGDALRDAWDPRLKGIR